MCPLSRISKGSEDNIIRHAGQIEYQYQASLFKGQARYCNRDQKSNRRCIKNAIKIYGTASNYKCLFRIPNKVLFPSTIFQDWFHNNPCNKICTCYQNFNVPKKSQICHWKGDLNFQALGKKLINNQKILAIVKRCLIPFENIPVKGEMIPKLTYMSYHQELLVDQEILEMLRKRALQKVPHNQRKLLNKLFLKSKMIERTPCNTFGEIQKTYPNTSKWRDYNA